MTQTTACLLSDSVSIEELTCSLERGAVRATCNPVIVIGMLKKEMGRLARPDLSSYKRDANCHRRANRLAIVRELSIKAAELLEPVLEQQKGKAREERWLAE
jgi:transaldolase